MEPSHDDGFKWFGEGFDGFPKHLADNTVEYDIFVISTEAHTDALIRSRLITIQKNTTRLTKELLKNHIWQQDAFALQLHESTTTSAAHLHGRTAFGDAISDEWLIVYILVELSKKYTDVWIRITDTDGEFLLIEAASALPKWLNPDIAENRVWISNGHLKLIPLTATDKPGSLKQNDAISFIREHKEDTIISPFVEDAAFARLKDYPAAIADSLHHAMITIPRRLAYILHENPAYISPAIDAFYLRDAVALQPLATKDLSTLTFPPEDFSTVSVKFTKVGYAQLRGQVFDAPPSWIGIAPRLKEEKVQMGMKLTCGFEMLLADTMNKDKKSVREVNLLLEELENKDAALPTEEEMQLWSQQQDNENWLTIDYSDFEAELSGKKAGNQDDTAAVKTDAGTAQDNLRKMVSRFQDFVNDDDTADPEDLDNDSDTEVSSSGEDKDGSFDDAEFEKAMKDMMGMSDQDRLDAGLVEEARKLALADGEVDIEEEDEETRRMMELIEEELKDAGALRRKANRAPTTEGNVPSSKSVVFGPELPPGFKRDGEAEKDNELSEEEIGPGDVELSSDDEDYNDVDVNLARNLLESFKGQAGASGPAGNLMRAMGITMPRDEDGD